MTRSRRIQAWTSFLLATLMLLAVASTNAQTTQFTYQGKLTDGGSPASGSYDLQFKLFDTVTLGTGAQQGSTLTLTNVTVTNGIFTVQLDFGACPSCFNGADRFLEIAVKLTSGSTFTTLGPRQPITSTPYALKSLNAAVADGLSVVCVNCVTSSQIGSVNGSAIVGTIPPASLPPGSGSYIQNTTTQQSSSNFSISGSGAIGGSLGIGTTSPLGKLHVVTANDTNPGSIFPWDDRHFVVGNSASNGAIGMSYDQTNNVGYIEALTPGVAWRNLILQQGGGNVGIGTTTPQGRLEVNAGLQPRAGDIEVSAFGSTISLITGRKANGTTAAPSAVQASNILALFGGRGYGTSEYGSFTGAMVVAATENWTNTAQGTRLSFNTAPNGSTASTERMRVDQNGNVGIGTNSPSERLEVGGNVRVYPSSGPGSLAFRNRTNADYSQAVFLDDADTFRGYLGYIGSNAPAPLVGRRNMVEFGSNGTDISFQPNQTEVMRLTTGGRVGIGTTTPGFKLDVADRMRVRGGAAGTPGIWFNTTGVDRAFVGLASDTTVGFYGQGGGWGLLMETTNGDITLPLVRGEVTPAVSLCWETGGLNRIVTCSSSLRYKTSLHPFAGGLNVINRLKPITFTWKDGGMRDLGLGAEDVAEVEPLLTFKNAKGEIEGVKYDRLGVVFINAFKEQQAQIKNQREQIERLKHNAAQNQKQMRRQQEELSSIKQLVCLHYPKAATCKARRNAR